MVLAEGHGADLSATLAWLTSHSDHRKHPIDASTTVISTKN